MIKANYEKLATDIHKVYCQYVRDIRGEEYWTQGNYDLLDDDVKEADRYMARFFIDDVIKGRLDFLPTKYIKWVDGE